MAACLLAVVPGPIAQPERFAQPKELALHAAALATTLMQVRALRRDWPDTADIAAATFVALGAVSAVLVAQNRWLSWRALGVTASAVLIFWAARRVRGDGHAAPLLTWTGVALGCLGIAGLFEAYGVLPSLSPPGRAPGSVLGNRNALARVLVVGLPVLWWCGAHRYGSRLRWAFLAATVAASTCITVTRARSAWLASAVLVALAAGVWAVGAFRRQDQARPPVGTWLAAVAAGVTFAVLVPNALAWRSEAPYADTGRRLLDADTGTGRGRLIQYRNTVRMAWDYPALGVGPGNWTIVYPRYASPGDPSYTPRGFLPVDGMPRSDWVGMAAERGVAALLALAAGAAALIRLTWRDLRSKVDRERYIDSMALLGVLVMVGVLGTFDPLLQMPAPAYVVAVAVGALAPTSSRSASHSVGSATWLMTVAAVAAVALVALVQGARRTWAAQLYVRHPSLHAAARAARLDPSNYEFRILLADYWSRRGRCDHARVYVREARRLYPTAYPPVALAARCRLRPEKFSNSP